MWAYLITLLGCGGSTVDSDIIEYPPGWEPGGGGGNPTDVGADENTDAVADTDAVFNPLEVRIDFSTQIIEEGEQVVLTGTITGTNGHPVEVAWASSVAGPLGTDERIGDGQVQIVVDGRIAGWHEVTLTATSEPHTTSGSTVFGVCAWPDLEDFDGGLPDGWITSGAAHWDERGWLEVTGEAQNRRGAMFYTAQPVRPGDVAIEFDIATGGGINSGADGYAVSVVKADSEADLLRMLDEAKDGGCLAYGWSEPCGELVDTTAFHIEIDTWFNEEYNDPSEQHLAITLNGDPSVHYYFASVPSLEDLKWRHVRVETKGEEVKVFVNDREVTGGAISGFDFEGGFIGISGSTGWATNHHRFDNLQLYDRCEIPDLPI